MGTGFKQNHWSCNDSSPKFHGSTEKKQAPNPLTEETETTWTDENVFSIVRNPIYTMMILIKKETTKDKIYEDQVRKQILKDIDDGKPLKDIQELQRNKEN